MATSLVSTGVQYPDSGTKTTGITINGPAVNSTIFTTPPQAFTITDFDAYTTYTLSTSNGTVTRSGSTISYTPSTAGTGSFVINGRTIGPFNVSAVAPPGQQVYTTAGTYTWTVPAGITSVSVVAVGGGGCGDDGNSGDGGGGGGGGAGLAYANNIPVTPGSSYTVVVGAGGTNGNGKNTRAQDGGTSTFTVGSFLMTANGGQGGAPYSANPGANGGSFSFTNTPGGVTTGGGGGGVGGAGYDGGGGGGGAGGYTGAGGRGSDSISANAANGTGIGSGGGGGAASSAGTGNGGGNGGTGQNNITGGGGGGANIYSASNPATNGGNGNGSTSSGSQGGSGGRFGGGGGGSWDNNTGAASAGGTGAVRIIWPGTTRQFPYTNVGDV